MYYYFGYSRSELNLVTKVRHVNNHLTKIVLYIYFHKIKYILRDTSVIKKKNCIYNVQTYRLG